MSELSKELKQHLKETTKVHQDLSKAETSFSTANLQLLKFDETLRAYGKKGNAVLKLWDQYDTLMELRQKALSLKTRSLNTDYSYL